MVRNGVELDYSVQGFENQKTQYVSSLITITRAAAIIADFLGFGSEVLSTVEANVSSEMLRKGKVRKFKIDVVSNTLDAALAITLRKNGADTLQTVNIPLTSSVDVESAVEIEFAKGDLLNLGFVAASTTGTITLKVNLVLELES